MDTDTTHTNEDDAAWLRSLADSQVESPAVAQAPASLVPPLDRERPARRPLVPRAVWVGLGVLVASVVLLSALFAWGSARSQVPVPGVVGLDLGVARTTLQRVGLTLVVTEERFSSSPEDVILSQSPSAGGMLKRGDAVEVIVSAGTEEVTMPDVVGDGLALAMGKLEALGLAVEVERVVSDTASDTVLATVPAAGALVRSGDTIRMQVASHRDSTVDLKPFRLDGVTVVIDPQPAPAGLPNDPAIEVARRLEAMVTASGGRAVVLRSALDTAPSDAARAAKAAEASPTVCIGLSVAAGGAAGRVVSVPPSSTPSVGGQSSRLGTQVIAAINTAAPPIKLAESTYDPVLTRPGSPWVRLLLGSSSAREDTTLFADPGWSDRVARALYSALGQVYGQAVVP